LKSLQADGEAVLLQRFQLRLCWHFCNARLCELSAQENLACSAVAPDFSKQECFLVQNRHGQSRHISTTQKHSLATRILRLDSKLCHGSLERSSRFEVHFLASIRQDGHLERRVALGVTRAKKGICTLQGHTEQSQSEDNDCPHHDGLLGR
jgi:hypothetical protein